MDVFEAITNDPEIREIYEKIYVLEDEEGDESHHGLIHVTQVAALAEKLLSGAGADSSVVEDGRIAGYLHDVGRIEGKKAHAESSYRFVKEYFTRKGIELPGKDRVLGAIRCHSDGFDADEPVALAVILSDKINLPKERLARHGYDVPGIRQLQFIKDVQPEISGGRLKVRFYCSEDIDLPELRSFIFFKKVGKALDAFSRYFGLVWSVDFVISSSGPLYRELSR